MVTSEPIILTLSDPAMKRKDALLQKLSYAFTLAAVLAGPWFFGSWEMWWFWPFMACIFLGAFFTALHAALAAFSEDTGLHPPGPAEDTGDSALWRRRQTTCFLLFIPFVAYSAWHLITSEVFVSAERSLLLIVSPLLLGLTVTTGLNSQQRRQLFVLILMNISAIGVYGILNHLATGNRLVLWAEGYPQYYRENRATGCYYCPDHFAGIMELGICMGAGMMLAARASLLQRLAGAGLASLGTICVILSKSRGGGLTLVVIALAALAWGLANRPVSVRWWWRIAGAAGCGILLSLMVLFAEGYRERFLQYFGGDRIRGLPPAEKLEIARKSTAGTARGVMYAGAWRAWQTSPLTGIGAGMHGSLWPHFAPSPDGDRASGRWPGRLNNRWHSNEVHSDWLQLLEEYGLVGLLLFLLPFAYLFRTLSRALKLDASNHRRNAKTGFQLPRETMAITALLALSAFAFHSLGDFNLQMPATTWVLSALICIELGLMCERRMRRKRS